MQSRRTVRMVAVPVVAVVAGGILAACGGGAPSIVPATSGDIDTAAVLRVTSAVPTGSLDPHLQRTFGETSYLTPIFDRLIVVDSADNLVPGLAESWEFAPDGSYLELRLRTDVRFHDGAPFDAAAVAANIRRGQTLEGSTVAAALGDITAVDVVDDHTVRLVLLPGTGVELPGVFGTNVGMMISPKAIAAGADIRNDPGHSGSGAYVVTKYVPQESVSLTRAEGVNWDAEAGKLAGIEFTWIPDASTRLNGVRTGMTDLSWVSSANEVVEAGVLAEQGVLDVDRVPFRNVLGLYMRPQGDLAAPEVRQAVASAIDPDAISALFSGTCTPQRNLHPAGDWATDESYRYPYPFDVDKARSLVDAAGGAKITLTYAAGTNAEKPANVIQSALSQVGFDAELDPVPNTQTEPRYIAGDFQTNVANTFSARTDPAETVATFVTGPYDLANGNARIEELAGSAANPTLSQEERAPLYREIWDLTLREAMFVPICNQTNATISNGKVIGIADMPWVNRGIFDVRHVGIVE